MKLRLNTGGLFTSITLDGQALGERAWAPFEWTIPTGLRGKKGELKIVVWTSMAPMFNFDLETFPNWSGMPTLDKLPARFYVDDLRCWQLPVMKERMG